MEKAGSLKWDSAPHIKSVNTTSRIIWAVVVCLLPAGGWGVFIFGLNALAVLITSILAALVAELAVNLVLKQRLTLRDGSACLTGLLIGYSLPPAVPLFIPIIAAFFAVLVVKHTFGGLGRNWMNPALAGRVFVMFCFPDAMRTWTAPLGVDGFTGATPLALGPARYLAQGSYWDLFIGRVPGSIGEVSVLLLLAGALYLIVKGIITWDIPFAYLAGFCLLFSLFGGERGAGVAFPWNLLFHLLSGSLVLGAFFMATDPVTTPLTTKGRLCFGLGCGCLTFLIRMYGGYPEGVSLAVIVMNLFVPLINHFTGPAREKYRKGAQSEYR